MITRRNITRLWMALSVGGVAWGAFAVPEVAQNVAGRMVDDAYAGNPLAIGVLIAIVILAGFLIAADKAASIWVKIRGKRNGNGNGNGKETETEKDIAGVHEHLRKIDENVGSLRADTMSGQAKLEAQVSGIQRDIDRLWDIRKKGS